MITVWGKYYFGKRIFGASTIVKGSIFSSFPTPVALAVAHALGVTKNIFATKCGLREKLQSSG